MSSVTIYKPLRHPAPVDLLLASNEGPTPPGLEALPAGELQRYPQSAELEAVLARSFGLDATRVVVTAGVDDALLRVALANLSGGDRALVAAPTFVMIPRYVQMAGAELVSVPWPASGICIDSILEAADERTRVLFVVSPNNPTGQVVTGAQLRRLSRALPETLLVLDHAYVELADEDLTQLALELPRCLVLRTFSKAWGLAALRVGYALGPREEIERLRAVGNPFPVSAPALRAAQTQYERARPSMLAYASRVRQERAELRQALIELGFECCDSQANFVYARGSGAAWLHDALAGLGIAVRGFRDSEGVVEALRITCPGSRVDFERLLEGLQSALRPEVLLFDLDGVLADVSRSYRSAILRTAESFGASLDARDITAAKAEGNANDDWELTRRLMASKGISISFERVQERFGDFYQGSPERPGLREEESLMVSRKRLQAWSRCRPLGIVTGRPLADALRFLEEQNCLDLFEHVIAREHTDALKPDPAPVLEALERFGVERAWFVGDTPDDVRAARGARVVPLGVVAPGEDAALCTEALFRSGAASVFSRLSADLDQLMECLP